MRDRIARIGLASLFVLLAVSLLLVERAPPIIAILAVLLAAVGAHWGRVKRMLRSSPIMWLAGAFVFWLLMSTLWSIAETEAISNGLRIATMIAAAVMVPMLSLSHNHEARSKAGHWALVACCLTVVLLLLETLFDMPLLRSARYLVNSEIFTNVPPSAEERVVGVAYHPTLYLTNRLTHLASIVSIVLIPTAGYLLQRGATFSAIGLLAAGLLALTLSPADAPVIALAAGAVVAAAMLVPAVSRSRRVAAALPILVAIMVVALPWLVQVSFTASQSQATGMDASVIHRLAIWDHVAGAVAERPVLGSGIEASRVLGREGADLGQLVPGHPTEFQALPLHPHNASLQIWLELGGIGALIFALFLAAMTRAVHGYSKQRVGRAALLGGWVAGLTVAHLSYGIWQYWWIASLGLAVAMIALMLAEQGEG